MLAVELFDGHSAHLRVRAVFGVLRDWLRLLHRLTEQNFFALAPCSGPSSASIALCRLHLLQLYPALHFHYKLTGVTYVKLLLPHFQGLPQCQRQ